MENFETKESKIVKLNIGGTKFTTTKDTLRGSLMLSKLIENDENKKMYILKDEENHYFVDRNAEYFGLVLEYLRTNKLEHLKTENLKNILDEFEFYAVDPLPPNLCYFKEIQRIKNDSLFSKSLKLFVEKGFPDLFEKIKQNCLEDKGTLILSTSKDTDKGIKKKKLSNK